MEELILGAGAPQKHSVWDNYVPIIASGRHTDIYLTDSIEAPSEYNQVCHILRHAFKGDTVTLFINSGGGYIDSSFAMIDAIKASKASVTAHIVGTVASAATMLALACSEIVIADHVQFMIHNYSGSASGKGNEIKAQVEFTDKAVNKAFECFYAGFLTPLEMELVIAGKDFWMGKEELQLRLATRKAKDTKALEKIAADKKAGKL